MIVYGTMRLSPYPRASSYGLLGCSIGLLAVLAAVVIQGMLWAPGPPAMGLYVRTKVAPAAEQVLRLMVTVDCRRNLCGQGGVVPTITLNGNLVSQESLPEAIRAELSRNVRAVVYFRGTGEMDVGQMIRIMDTIRDGWFGVPVVLLTPESEKTLLP